MSRAETKQENSDTSTAPIHELTISRLAQVENQLEQVLQLIPPLTQQVNEQKELIKELESKLRELEKYKHITIGMVLRYGYKIYGARHQLTQNETLNYHSI
ncbi:MAG: hypothetical protein P1U63_05970 [Coxiellaceae bacterium]|nr:hypothetical protein [Coxiellaceae bacterium]